MLYLFNYVFVLLEHRCSSDDSMDRLTSIVTGPDYKNGFGSTSGEVWLGNDNIHSLTSKGKHELRIELEAFDGETGFAEYSGFSIDVESEKYVAN